MNLIFELGLRGSLIFLLIAGLDRVCGRSIGAISRRWWWVLVAVTFLAPVHLSLIPAPPLREIVLKTAAEIPAIGRIQAEKIATSTPTHPKDWLAIVRWIWLVGAVGYIGLVAARTVRVQRRWSSIRLSTDPALLELLEDCKREAGVTAPIGLVISPTVSALAILGWLRPRILLPIGLVGELSREQLRAVLLHELAHFRYADVPTTWLFTLAQAIHWFNPFAYLASASWVRFREEAADEAAIRWMGETTGQKYGEVLLQAIGPNNASIPFGALGIGESFNLLKKRLLMIHHYSPKSPRWLFAGAITLLLAGITSFQISRAADVPTASAPDDAIWATPNVEVSVPSSALEAVVGRYDYVNAIMTVTREGDQVYAQLAGQPRFEIFPKSESVFFWKVVDAQVAFVKNDHGVVVKAMHHQGGTILIAQRLTEALVAKKIDPTVFDAYVGNYKPGATDVTLAVSREGDRFFIQLTGQPKLEILPKTETDFFLKDVNAQLTFVKNAKGKAIKVINHQGGQNIEFSRPD